MVANDHTYDSFTIATIASVYSLIHAKGCIGNVSDGDTDDKRLDYSLFIT